MEYRPYKRNMQYSAPENILDVTEYGVAVAGMMGADTTPADLTLCAGQAARLFFAPESVQKPKNEKAKLVASLASIVLGEITGKKRKASAVELIAMGVIDITIKN